MPVLLSVRRSTFPSGFDSLVGTTISAGVLSELVDNAGLALLTDTRPTISGVKPSAGSSCGDTCSPSTCLFFHRFPTPRPSSSALYSTTPSPLCTLLGPLLCRYRRPSRNAAIATSTSPRTTPIPIPAFAPAGRPLFDVGCEVCFSLGVFQKDVVEVRVGGKGVLLRILEATKDISTIYGNSSTTYKMAFLSSPILSSVEDPREGVPYTINMWTLAKFAPETYPLLVTGGRPSVDPTLELAVTAAT